MIELKQMTGPVYNADYKHSYERDHYTPTDSNHLVGPVYGSERSSYGHDFYREGCHQFIMFHLPAMWIGNWWYRKQRNSG